MSHNKIYKIQNGGVSFKSNFEYLSRNYLSRVRNKRKILIQGGNWQVFRGEFFNHPLALFSKGGILQFKFYLSVMSEIDGGFYWI